MNKMILLSCLSLLSTQAPDQRFVNMTEQLNSHAIYQRTMDVRTADLNNDGHLDIVLAVEWAPNAILWGSADGKFRDDHSLKLSTNTFDSEDVAIADFNGDEWLDLVFAAEDDKNHEFYLNQGNGEFIELKNKFPKFISNAVITYDFNGDGHMDLIFGNQGQSRLFINDGKANFTEETALRLPQESYITQDIALIDANKDGHMDLILGNENGNQIWINNGAGFFENETETRFPISLDVETRKVIVFDANNDGFPDVLFCNVDTFKNKNIRDLLYINDGKGNFKDVSATQLPTQDLATLDAVAMDVNFDGHMDLVLAHMGKVRPSVLINDGFGGFKLDEHVFSDIPFQGNYISVLVEDFNKDGQLDLYFGGFMTQDKLLINNPVVPQY